MMANALRAPREAKMRMIAPIQDRDNSHVEISAPRKLVFTWSSALPAIDRSLVTIELRPVGAATELTLTHENLPDTDEGRAHSVGWEGTLNSLERHLMGETSPRQ